MSKPNLETRTRNVNNKTLFKEIDDFLIEVFTSVPLQWRDKDHRQELVNLIEQWLDEYAAATGKIIQHDVLCDTRNNTNDELEKGRIHFTVRYRQKNCLNTTEIDYIFEV